MHPVTTRGLAQLEILCKQLYETTDSAVRLQAEKALVEFTNSPDCLSKCQLLLERGSSSYSQLLAATCLSKLVSRTSNPLPLEQRIDIREFPASTLTPSVQDPLPDSSHMEVRTEEVRTEEVRTQEVQRTLGQRRLERKDIGG
ncbi:hypothetical protein JOQ06_028716 [Pogonophryne albipinna]|uniref:Importin N-terminal domain-containing protein n=1 Tax=Pogonophryne albipinna TaxID=1090488 RepID=A0AAD6B711_9TELE|nr:hypothetical protein JOQ06_028716 [Pogonophryne albipinna]